MYFYNLLCEFRYSYSLYVQHNSGNNSVASPYFPPASADVVQEMHVDVLGYLVKT